MRKFALLALLSLWMVACDTNTGNVPNVDDPMEQGKISLALNPEGDITVVETMASEETNVNEFEVDILDQQGVSYAKYASYADVPAEVALPAGSYSIAAKSGRLLSAEFDAPHYAGMQDFTVEVGKTSAIGVTCVITNVKVTVEYSEKILSTLTDIKASVSSAYDPTDNTKVGRLVYTPAETRAGWFAKPANKLIEVYVTGKNKTTGASVTTSTTLSGVESRQWRKMTLDIKTSGSIDVDITIDETLIEKPVTDIVIPDGGDIIDNNGDSGDWEEPDGPGEPEEPTDKKPAIVGSAFGVTGSTVSFDIDQEVVFVNGTDEVLDVLMTSTATAGISNLFLLIESEALAEVLTGLLGITGEIDLANPDTAAPWYEMFCDPSLGILDTEIPIKGKSSHTFAVGGLMSLLGSVSEKGQTHKFHLRLIDANGEVAKTLTITLQ